MRLTTAGCLGAPILVISMVTCAAAKDAWVGKVQVVLSAPEHYCELVETEPADRQILHALRTGLGNKNELLAEFADCDQLRALREDGKTLDNFAQYMTPTNSKQHSVSAGDIAELCALARSKGDEIIGKAFQEVRPRIEEIVEGLKLNEAKFLGVVAETTPTCYWAVIAKIQSEPGRTKTQISLIANTLS